MKCEFITLRELGRGNSGLVFKAVHVPTLHVVAIKRVRMQRRQRHEVVQELQSLYSNLVTLGDFQTIPNCRSIVSFHGAFTNAEEMSMSLVLEYMDYGRLDWMEGVLRNGRRFWFLFSLFFFFFFFFILIICLNTHTHTHTHSHTHFILLPNL